MLNPVGPPPLLKPVVNLIDSANQPVDTTNGRWTSGLSFRPWPSTSGWADDPCNDGAMVTWVPYAGNDPSQLVGTGGTVDYRPPVFNVYDQGSAFGFELKEYALRVRILSDVALYKQLEAEFWTGALARAKSYPNPYLTNPATVQDLTSLAMNGASLPSVKKAFSVLEQALADYGQGARGIIHCRVEAAPPLPMVRREENKILTGQDNLVVSGHGYPNLGPNNVAAAAGTTWLYATGMVDVRVDEARIFPDPSDFGTEDEFLVEAMDRNKNAVVVRAERFAAAVFDPQCHFAVHATLDS